MKNTTRKEKMHKQPSDKTRWAYMMQAIEPTSEAINRAFPGYHPQWVQQSQQLTIGAANFRHLRKLLGMTQIQCAGYLRAGESTVRRWESGSVPVPFIAFELLRLVLESVRFKTSHAAWDGWFISDDGKLMSPDYGRAGYTPEQLNMYSLIYSENAWLRGEVSRLQDGLNEAVAENIKLRQMYLTQGVTDELVAMQDKLTELLANIGTARVIPFPTIESEQPQEMAA